MLTNVRALVTGGAGFLGSHVAEQLLRSGAEVTVLDDLSGGFLENVPKGCRFVQASVEDVAMVGDVFRDGMFTHVYHLAAYAAEGLSHHIRRYNYSNNLLGTVNLVNRSIESGVQCFVFTSSIAVYGRGQLPFTEADIPSPEDPYGIAKYAVELDLRCAYDVFGLNYVIFRPHNVYGERQNIWDLYRNVIGIFINKALRGESLPVFGDGTQSRAFSYVGDVAAPIARSGLFTECYNQVFNIGADEVFTIAELVATLSDVIGRRLSVEHFAERPEVRHAYSSHRKVRDVFGELAGNTPLREGLTRMLAWAARTTKREGARFTDIEIRDRLPAAWR